MKKIRPRKEPMRMWRILYAVACATAVISFSGCATHMPTDITRGFHMPQKVLPENTVDIVPSMYYLDKVDSLEGSRRSRMTHDEGLIRSVLHEELQKLPSRSGIEVVATEANSDARFRCDFKVHQSVAWSEILFVLLPIPRSVNESICAEAVLVDSSTGQVVKRYEEWGFNKQTGFWFIFEGKDNPPMSKLRNFVVRKVLSALASDLSA